MMIRNALTAAAVVSFLAACAGTPTAPLGDQLPAERSLENGYTMGSGGRAPGSDSENTSSNEDVADGEAVGGESGS